MVKLLQLVKSLSNINIWYVFKKRIDIGRKTAATNHSCHDKKRFTSMSRCFVVKYVQDIPRSDFQYNPRITGVTETSYIHIWLVYDYIPDGILCWDQIDYRRNINTKGTDD